MIWRTFNGYFSFVCIMLEKQLWNSFCICWLKSCDLYIKQVVSQRSSMKMVFWRTSENSEETTRSSHQMVFCQKVILKNFEKFAKKKQLCWNLFLMKLTVWRPAKLLERDPKTGVSTFCELCEIFRRGFLQNSSW